MDSKETNEKNLKDENNKEVKPVEGKKEEVKKASGVNQILSGNNASPKPKKPVAQEPENEVISDFEDDDTLPTDDVEDNVIPPIDDDDFEVDFDDDIPGLDDDVVDDFDDDDDEVPGLDDDDDDVLEEETEDVIPEVEEEDEEDEEDLIPGITDEIDDDMIPGVTETDEEDDDVIPGLEDESDDDMIPGVTPTEEVEDDTIPGLEDESDDDMIPGVTPTEEVEDDTILGLEDDSNDDMIPGVTEIAEEDDDVIPGLEDESDDDMIPGVTEAEEVEDDTIPGLEDESDDDMIPGVTETEEVEDDTIPGLENESDDDTISEEEVNDEEKAPEDVEADDEEIEAGEEFLENLEEVSDTAAVEKEKNKKESDDDEPKFKVIKTNTFDDEDADDIIDGVDIPDEDEVDFGNEEELSEEELKAIQEEANAEDEDDYVSYEDLYGSDEPEEEEEDDDDDDEPEEKESIYPDELIDLELECIYIGLLFNNPKAMSRFYLLYEDCRFSDDELTNLYKIVLFRDGEQYAPAKAKDKYQLPRETPNTYELKLKVRRIAASKDYNLENVYTELKKLFILKKNYVVAATSKIQEKIVEITKYELYSEMTVEEVESALEQITVTTGLTQGRLNEGATEFLLAGDNELSNGLSIPFPILSSVFKGLRRGETMCYAMPSNSGKSRFTINLAAYISFIHKEKVLIISNEMAEDKMKLCMITTIVNNPEIQKIHGQEVSVTESELLELKFKPDKGKKVKCDENGYILRKDGESQEEYIERLKKNSSTFKHVLKVTDWVDTQVNNSIFFIHITEHTNDDLRKIIMNYYYKEGIHYMFYDTLKADTANIGNSDEVKKTATILSNLAQKFRIFIASSMQLIESNTLPVNLTVNEMSASKTVKEVLDTLCLIKQINRTTCKDYEYSDTDLFEKNHDIVVPKDTDVRFYACVVDKNRAGAKPTVLFRLNLAYNRWEELGHVKLKAIDAASLIERS